MLEIISTIASKHTNIYRETLWIKKLFYQFSPFSKQINHGRTQNQRTGFHYPFIQHSWLRIMYQRLALCSPIMQVILRKQSPFHQISTIAIWSIHVRLKQVFKKSKRQLVETLQRYQSIQGVYDTKGGRQSSATTSASHCNNKQVLLVH